MIGLGANLPEDAIYPRTMTDADGQPLVGSGRYMIRFSKAEIPPVDAFWSIAVYNAKHFFEQNPLNRYSIGDRDELMFDEDGSITLYIQHESPGADREKNWLPAPTGPFNLLMRLYSPKKEILNGTWKPPAIQKDDSATEIKAA
jgi:hypothetical protein